MASEEINLWIFLNLWIWFNMKYIYTIISIGLILIIWFAPIDLEREKLLANTGPKRVVIYMLESTWLKLAFTIILGLLMISLHKPKNYEESWNLMLWYALIWLTKQPPSFFFFCILVKILQQKTIWTIWKIFNPNPFGLWFFLLIWHNDLVTSDHQKKS